MKKWILKSLLLFIPVFALVVLTNFFVDPANIFHASMIDYIFEGISENEAVEVVGDFDEGKLLERRITEMTTPSEIMIMGSSHVLYVDWEFDDYTNIGMSGEFLDDYYATVGLLKENNVLPKTLIIGVDPYIFMDGLSIRQESLTTYANNAKETIAGNPVKRGLFENGEFDKVKELFSFPYFQSSVNAFFMGVNASYVNPSDNSDMGDYPKILKNGRRVPTEESYMTMERMDSASNWDVENGAIYCMVDFRSLSESKKTEWENLLSFLQNEGVEVIIYLPAWYPIYYDAFCTKENFSGVILAEEYIREDAANRGIKVQGSYNPYVCGIEREDFLDYFHLNPEGGVKNYNYCESSDN